MAVKHCVLCGKEFVDYGRGKYCDGPHYKTCIICGNQFEYNIRVKPIPKTCSPECRGKLAHHSTVYSPKLCIRCGAEFRPNSGVQKTCDNCSNAT